MLTDFSWKAAFMVAFFLVYFFEKLRRSALAQIYLAIKGSAVHYKSRTNTVWRQRLLFKMSDTIALLMHPLCKSGRG